MLRVSEHAIEPGPRLSQESTEACAAVMSRPERSSGRLSRPRSPCVRLTGPELAAGMRLVFRASQQLSAFCSAFHRATCLATLATELPLCVRVHASTPVRSELLIDQLAQISLAGSCLFGTVALHIFLCRVRVTDCVDPAAFRGSVCPLGVLGRRLSPAV